LGTGEATGVPSSFSLNILRKPPEDPSELLKYMAPLNKQHAKYNCFSKILHYGAGDTQPSQVAGVPEDGAGDAGITC
jgi:hypothetical protein